MSPIETSQEIPENNCSYFCEWAEKMVHHKPISEEVYLMIKNAIQSGNLKPGQRLIEQKISEQMKVSRTPVREAIKKLHHHGIVVRSAMRGFIVKKQSCVDIEEALAIRSVLEGYAARRACERSDNALIIALRKNIDASFWALKEGDLENALDLNVRFHQLIYKSAESFTLEKLIDIYNDYIDCCQKVAPRSENDVLSSLEIRTTMVKAMVRGDEDTVERIARSLAYPQWHDMNKTRFGSKRRSNTHVKASKNGRPPSCRDLNDSSVTSLRGQKHTRSTNKEEEIASCAVKFQRTG